MTSLPTTLSEDVVAVVNGYERRETEGDRVKYYIKADKATTFSDNHQELENVFLQVFNQDGDGSDTITAAKSKYVPAEGNDFTAFFAGNVEINSRDGLKVNTDQLAYKRNADVAEAEEPLVFERGNIKGSANAAKVNIGEQKLELLSNVEIETADISNNGSDSFSKTTAQYALYDHKAEKITLTGNVESLFTDQKNGATETAKTNTDRMIISLKRSLDEGELGESLSDGMNVDRVDMNGNVAIDVVQGGAVATKIRAANATHIRSESYYELAGTASIERFSGPNTSTVGGDTISYFESSAKAIVNGNAKAAQGTSAIAGGRIVADFFPDRNLKTIVVTAPAVLIDISEDRTTDVRANDLTANFNQQGFVQTAKASGSPVAILKPVNESAYTKVTMNSGRSIDLTFRAGNAIEKMISDGRTTIRMDVPNNAEDSANKVVIADTVRTFFRADGKNLERAEAVGDAELHIEPLRKLPANFRSVTNAPRFDCTFFAAGNNPQNCDAGVKTKTVRTPTVPSPERGVQTISSDRLTASFIENTNGLSTLAAAGNAKFVELSRNATSESFSFDNRSGVLSLRGKEPTVWDDRARARAKEIDWNTREQRTSLRGGVSTTYFSQRAAGDSTPFGRSDKPVFVTSDSAEIDHKTQVAVYNTNARGWQDDSYIRADTLRIEQTQGRLFANGNVNSLVYQNSGGTKRDPVNAMAGKMSYHRNGRLIQYEENVDMRRGTDRLTGRVAKIYMDERNEISRSEFDGDVVVTQPQKRATGDFARYDAVAETVYLRGAPATVDDGANGRSAGNEFTVYLKSKRVEAESRSADSGSTNGRIRSVHKIKSN